MAHNDFLPIEDNTSKKSIKKQIIWTTLITIVLGFFALFGVIEGYARNVEYQSWYFDHATSAVIIMLITAGLTFFLILSILLLKSIEWKDPIKCENTLHYFYLAILVLTIVGIFSGIVGLIA